MDLGGVGGGGVEIVGRVFIIINGCYELVLIPGCNTASASAQ